MKAAIWALWIVASVGLASYLGYELNYAEEKPDFLIGETTHGHYQIELKCDACHTEPFGTEQNMQTACETCHAEELKASLDSHPRKKFTDPRNADLVAILDARQCVSCHSEHNPDVTHPMGLTLQEDYCVQCHKDIGEERESHQGLGFETCASAGCHNYHDNKALYEDFLLKHANSEVNPHQGKLLDSTLSQYLETMQVSWPKSGLLKQTSHPVIKENTTPEVQKEWVASAHGKAQVGCLSCHAPESKNTNDIESHDWIAKPNVEECSSCHKPEAEGFLAGKHGMRLSQGLSPMTPAMARQPMHEAVGHEELSCNSCHSAHSDNRVKAAFESCISCHADEHTQAFESSPHGQLWQQVVAGDRPQEEAVSCATCHMPREEVTMFGQDLTQVQHNQNATLRPNEKMIRSSCLQCHDLQFSLNALADETLIQNNFNGQPSVHIKSIEMAIERDQR
ncbi:MAG: cytochrome c3 family protein [Oceanobacter sp.]